MKNDLDQRSIHILLYVKAGRFPTQIAKGLGMKRETCQYQLDKLEQKKLIRCLNPESNKYKKYQLTEAGGKIVAEYDAHDKNKELVGVENARFTCVIHDLDNLRKFLDHKPLNFKRDETALRHNIVQDSNIQGVFVRVIYPAREMTHASLTMTSPLFYADTESEAHHLMWENIIKFQNYIDKQWNLGLGKLRFDEEHVEFTWASPYAQEVMESTHGSPIKLKGYKINKSPPTFQDREEFNKFEELGEHRALPKKVRDIQEKAILLQSSTDDIDYKVDQTLKTISEMVPLMSNFVDMQKSSKENILKLSENVAVIAKNLNDLMSMIQGKNIQNQGKTEEKEFPLNSFSKSMYG